MNPVGYLETGVLYCDDNLHRLAEFPAECIDLIYLDPPFFSNKHYEVIWGDEAEVRSFEDRWEGGIQHYINWMRERVFEMHRVLRPTGSLYLHCDWHANHHLRLMLDDIFGAPHFQNDIAWCYREAINSAKRWNRKHDTILFYTKDAKEWTFNPNAVLQPHAASTVKKYRLTDENGPYRLMGRGITGSPIRSARDVSPEWERTNPELVYRQYLREGTYPVDYWNIDIINQASRERLGYPTQKPEELLERIIVASSNPGDIVLDPFCGCGTTIAVAERLGRQWVGMDISPTAVGLMKRRVERVGSNQVTVYGLPMSEDALRALKPYEFQNWVIQQVSGTHSPRKSGDMGIDGLSFMYHEPIQVKQSERVGRNVVDNFETAIERSGNDVGYIVAFSFTKGAYEEAARAKAAGKGTIVLVKVVDLLEAAEGLTRPTMPLPARRPTPELMRLLSAAEREIADRPLPPARPKTARPSVRQLIESDQTAEPVG